MVEREGMSPWVTGDFHETIPPAYLPTPTESCHYSSLHRLEERHDHWIAPDYSSYFTEYPTPHSDFSHSPQQQGHGELISSSLSGVIDPDFHYGAAQQNPTHLLTAAEAFPRTPRYSPANEPKSPYKYTVADERPTDGDEETDEDDSISGEPYAQLIGRALKSAPGHKMVLKDIYRWFEKNTNKARSGSKGWQNSIRHNLSMNGGFRKVDQDPPTDDSKRGFIWVLEPSAFREGVKSTTRYRKSGSNKKVVKARHPAPERQRSGAKGGRAARKAAKIRRSARYEVPASWKHEDIPLQSIESPVPNITERSPTPPCIWTPDSMGSFIGTASRSLTPHSTEPNMYSYGDIAGVTEAIPSGPLFAENGSILEADDALGYPPFGGDELVSTNLSKRLQRI
ncbi:MAG: hypothetical protein Q9181_004480 [Wetmoreana brouardii]